MFGKHFPSFPASGKAMKTILLIEHDPQNLIVLSIILHSFGYNVLEAASRGEAWRACHRHRGPIHLVIAKLILGEGSTSDFVTRLQHIYPQIRALVVSEASLAEAPDMPCEYALLQKPCRVDDLANVVKGLLEGAKIKIASAQT